MQLLGMTIDFRRTNERDRGHQKLSVDPHKDLGVVYRGRTTKHGGATRTDFLKNVIFPPTDGLNQFEIIRYDKLLHDFCDYLGARKKFDICTVREICTLTKRRFTQQTKEFYTNLGHLHMVAYENIPAEVIAEMPMMLSAIFTEGKSLRDVIGEREKEVIYLDRWGSPI